jgi:ComF family protein
MGALGALLRRVVNLILPADCAGCGAELAGAAAPFFCGACWARLEPIRGPVCPRCGQPFPSEFALTYSPRHVCGPCRLRPPAFTEARSLFVYAPPLRDAIHLLKYRGKVALAGTLGDLMAEAYEPPAGLEVIVPVPLHAARLRDREFNQSLLLADRLRRRLGLPVSPMGLVRLHATAPQTELSRSARLKNLRRAFAVADRDRLAGKTVLLVDDVFTTGTTVNECAKALRKAGSGDVFAVTLARTI